MNTRITPRALILASLALLLGVGRASAAEANLDQALAEKAPAILKILKDKGAHDVGVLKFLVDAGDGKLRDNAGTLNRTLADRLEAALILTSPEDQGAGKELGILVRASDSVAKLKDKALTHRTREGREMFFEIGKDKFLRAWGKLKNGPDAFVTGEAKLSRDLKRVTVTVQAFFKDKPDDLLTVCTFDAATDGHTLAETGRRYVSPYARGVLDANKKQIIAKANEGTPVSTIVQVLPTGNDSKEERKEKERVLDQQIEKESPVLLEVLYDGEPIEISNHRVRTPRAGQKVQFRLTNRDAKIRYGVVLQINGENSIDPEQTAAQPSDCRKWILDPNETLTIDGFQEGTQDRRAFEVLPPEQSDDEAINYGANAGMISLYVFRGATKEEEPALAEIQKPEPKQTIRLVARGSAKLKGNEVPLSLAALKRRLEKEVIPDLNDAAGRGMIVKGAQGKNEVKVVEFPFYKAPVYFDSIRYYAPAK